MNTKNVEKGTQNTLSPNEVEGSSATTDLLAFLSIDEKEQLLSQLYVNERDDSLKKFIAWKSSEQVDFVKNLLQTMSHHQHGQIEEFFQPILKRDFISGLPGNIPEYIFSLLDAKTLTACVCVSKNWKRAVAHGMLWRKLIERKIRTDSIWRGLSERRGWKRFLFVSKEQATYLIALAQTRNQTEAEKLIRQIRNPLEFQHDFYCRLYPQIVSEIKSLEDNWRSGVHWLQRINCESENSKGVYCLQYDDDKIISGLRDTTIKIWRRSDLQCDKRLAGHTGSVLCLQYDDRIIVSGSSDSSVRIWDVESGVQLNTLVHHSEAVLHLRFSNGMLVTCSKDRSIAVWDMVSPQEINLRRVLVGHRAAVNVVDFDHTYIVSASGDRTIKVWNADTCEFVRTLSGHTRGIACLQYRDRLVVSGSSDNTIRLWDVEVGTCLRTLEGHEELVRCIRFDSKKIVSGAYDGKIKIWDLKAAQDPRSPPNSICLKTLEQHTGRVFRLQFDEFQIVSSSHDDTILIWNFLNMNTNPDPRLPNMSAWPMLAHSSHRLLGSPFGAGDSSGRIRQKVQNQAAPLVQDAQVQVDAQQMEIDEPPLDNNESGSDSNNTDEEEEMVVNA